jgi:hypothetical protein
MVSPLNNAVCPLGGTPGNRGGGRPKDKVRAALRLAGAKRIKVLREIADGMGEDVKPSDRLKAVDVMLKYGLGVEHEVSRDDVRGRLRETIAMIRRELSPELAEPLLDKMSALWA